MSLYERGAEVAGRFVIEELIGKGGMGAVYRAEQISLGRVVALKVLHAQNAFTPKARRRFAREARAVARLNHRHIAGVYDFGVDDEHETLWLAMEFIDGHSLSQLKRDPVDLVRILSLADQILSALSAAHARGIVHRDLKPSNVIVTKDDEGHEIIKLVDFGLAATMEGDLNLEGAPGVEIDPNEPDERRALLGTPRYMAPELFRRQPADPRVDLYALGVILFEIIAGRPPFIGDDPKVAMKNHLFAPIPKLEARGDIPLPPDVEQCIYTLLAKEPRERFQAATEVREVVSGLVNDFSYVPWATMGPRNNDAATFRLAANTSSLGFNSSLGGQTLAPATLAAEAPSKIGAFDPQNAPLVGRVEERRKLEGPIKDALREGVGALVFMSGEEGVGKTRLADWIRVRVREAGVMRVARGYYSKQSQGFVGMRMVLEEVLGTSDYVWSDVPYAIEHQLKKWAFSREEIETCLHLMSPGEVGATYAIEASVTDQERIFATVEHILRRVAEDKPLLVVLEDIHEAGDATIGCLEHLAVGLNLRPAPIMILATMRQEEVSQAPRLAQAFERLSRFGTDGYLRVELPRLSVEEGVKLVQKLMLVEAELAQRVVERASGNPRQIVQILQFLLSSEKIERDGDRWRLKPDVQLTREVPSQLADMMRQRASRMLSGLDDPRTARALLERMAVLGYSFEYRLVRRMLELEPGQPWLARLDAGLEQLIRSGTLRELRRVGQDMLMFDHEIMRDVLLQDVSERAHIGELHLLAADAKVSLWGSGASRRALELAEHYERAGQLEGVYRFTIEAARSALAGSDLRASMRLFQQAEQLHDQLIARGESAPSAHVSGEQITLEVAHLERRLGDYDSSRQHYKRLLDGSPEVALWARWGLGELAYRQGDYDESTTWYETARRQSMEAQQYTSPISATTAQLVDAQCLYGLSCITFQRGDLKAARISLDEALERARKVDHRALEIDVLRVLAEVTWRSGGLDSSEIYSRRAMMLAEEHGDREAIAFLMLSNASYLLALGKPRQALDRANGALELFESIGKRHQAAHCEMMLGSIDWRSGAHREAAQRYRKAHRFYEMFRDRRGLTQCKFALAALALSIRRFPDAQTLVRDALEGFKAMDDRRGEALGWLIVGRLERELMKHARAARTFAEARRVLTQLGDTRMALCALALQALATEELGDVPAADALIDELLLAMREPDVFEEPLVFALDQLIARLQARRPGAVMELEQAARFLSTRLGIPQDVAAVLATS